MQNEKGITADWRVSISGKKVLLFVTSVSSLLSFLEKRIEKMVSVFDMVRKSENIVLWWRPHPLEFTTIESMRPHLKKAYLDAVQYFIDNNIGIIDKSEDPNRAMAVADAYIGDQGSMLHLFKMTGKPIFIINYLVGKTDPSFILRVSDFCVKDKLMYCVSAFYNCLFIMDMNSFKVIRVIKIPYGYPLMSITAYTVYLDGNIMYIYGGNKLFSFDIETESFTKYQPESFNYKKIIDYLDLNSKIMTKPLISNSDYIPENRLLKCYMADKGFDFCEKLFGCIQCKDKYVFIDMNNPIVMINDYKNKEKIVLNKFPENLDWLGASTFSDAIVYEDRVLLFPKFSNVPVEINVIENTVKKSEEFDLHEYGYHTMCAKIHDNILYVFMLFTNQVICFNLMTGEKNIKTISFEKKTENILKSENILECRDRISEGCFLCESAQCYSLVDFINALSQYEELQFENNGSSQTGQQIYHLIKKEVL